MKKLLTLAIAGVMAVSMVPLAATAAVADEETVALPATNSATTYASTTTTTQSNVYLVPGVNSEVTGAVKLSDAERTALYLENDVYYAGKVGDKLPAATTTRTASDGGALTFNGWWGIVDATVTYFTEVPEVTETFYLYADFRAELSQPMDPVAPTNDEEVLENYIEITRFATGKTETYGLYVSATDVSNAVGSTYYGGPVQFYNEWFELSPNDTFKVFVSGVYSSPAAGAQQCPQLRNSKCDVTLEASGLSSTGSIISKTHATSSYELSDRYFTCIASAVHTYRMYIKFYDGGGTMTIFMQAMD